MSTKIIVMGDFNADDRRRTDKRQKSMQMNDKLFHKWIDKDHTRYQNDNKGNGNTIKICDLNDFTNLYTQRFNNTFFKGQHSKIDRVLGYEHDWVEFLTCNIISCKNEDHELIKSGTNWRNGLTYIWDEDNPSDHRPVMFKIIIDKGEIAHDLIKPTVKEAKLSWTKEGHLNIYNEYSGIVAYCECVYSL